MLKFACVSYRSRLALIIAGLAGVNASLHASVTVVASGGAPAPQAGPGVVFSDVFTTPFLDDTGSVLFRGQMNGTGVTTANDYGVWYGQPGALAMLAREGDVAPDCAGAVFNVIGSPILSGGHVVFSATLTGTGVTSASNQGLFAGLPGNIRLIARKGTQVPGQVAGCVYNSISDFAAGVAGTVAFRSSLTGTGVTSSNDTAVSISILGVLQLGVREGTLLPSITPTAAVGDLATGNLTLNALNEVECVSTVTGAGAGTTQGLWRISTSGVQIMGRSRLAAPGTPTGQTWLDFFSATAMTSTGRSAFSGTLQGTGVNGGNNVGLWVGSPGSVTLAVRGGDFAPGTFLSFQAFTTTPHTNSLGDLAFAATLWGGGATSANNCGVWTVMGGQVQLLGQAGEQIPSFAPGVLFSAEPASRVLINDAGEVLMRWKLNDGNTNPLVLLKRSSKGTFQTLIRQGDEVAVSDFVTKNVSAVWLASTGNSSGDDGRGNSFNNAGLAAGLLGFSQGGVAIAVMRGACPGDINQDGTIDFFDYLDFVAAFGANDLLADFNIDGVVDFFDYLDFVAAFSQPC